jgi:hypothetical protein
MITRAALCPATPLLARPLSGREPVLTELRAACAAAVAWLLDPRPPAVVIVAPGTKTAAVDPGPLDLARYAPRQARGSGAPAGIGLGAMLLDEAGWDGPRRAWTVADEEPADLDDGVLLTLGDGSAARLLNQREDERADEFDAAVERAFRHGDLGALDAALAKELAVTGWPAWQALAAALGPGWSGDIRYSATPFGVRYYVATVRRAGGPGGNSP